MSSVGGSRTQTVFHVLIFVLMNIKLLSEDKTSCWIHNSNSKLLSVW
jgi:hypothetical protein